MPTRLRCLALAAVAAASVSSVVVRTQEREADPQLSAATLLDASLRTGPHHQVADEVRTPDDYHVFTVTSTFGTFTAEGTSQVAVRVQEITALAALQDVSKAGVVARAAGESLVKVGDQD